MSKIQKPKAFIVSIQDSIQKTYIDSLDITDSQKEYLKQGGVDALVAYIARVSSPNQANEKTSRLIKYCVEHGHYSILESSNITVEIITSRAIAAQILRHRTGTYQEFSQRYAKAQSFQPLEARLQDQKNRQNSIEVEDNKLQNEVDEIYNKVLNTCLEAYQEILDKGVAKEVARFVLPLSTTTKMYRTANLRDWVFYFEARAFGEGVQKEHRIIALDICKQFCEHMPKIAAAFDWEEKIKLIDLKFNLK